MTTELCPKLLDGDIVELSNGERGVIAGSVIAFPFTRFPLDYICLSDYNPCTLDYMYESEYDIAVVFRIDWGNDAHDGSREYEVIWKRKMPRDMLQDGDIVELRDEMDYTVSGAYFINDVTGKRICWDDFSDDLLHQGCSAEYDVMTISRNGEEIWRRE